MILISTDQAYTELLKSGFTANGNCSMFEQLSPDELFSIDLESWVSTLAEQARTLVILDFECLNLRCDFLATRLLKQRQGRAIECLVTRADFEDRTVQRLRNLGAFVFAEDEAVTNTTSASLRLLTSGRACGAGR